MFGSILSPESDSLNKSWADFDKCTGITIQYTGSNTFESDLPVKVSGGNPPDLAIIPQPGLLAQMVQSGTVKKPPAGTVANEANWNAAWKSYGSVNGTFYAAPMSANMKSLVWYSPKYFAAHGYTVPTTWKDLIALSDKIVADNNGAKPWCGGISSGTASGWPATDWLEEAVLGTYGGQVYDDWISHKVKFSRPADRDRDEDGRELHAEPGLRQRWLRRRQDDRDDDVPERRSADPDQQVRDAAAGFVLRGPVAQGHDGQRHGDVFAFYLPPVDPSITTPVEGGGEFVTAFSDKPAVQAVQNYLSSAGWADSRIKVATGWVSANSKVDQSLYTDPIDKISAKYLADPKATFRFDASDAMPAAVGSGEEWTAMVEWFGQGKSIDAVAKEIDAAWPN